MAKPARREPFGIELPRWFGHRFDDPWWDDLSWPERMVGVLGRSSVRVEEFSEDGTLVVRAELPGIDPDTDVEITVHDGLLHIKGERADRKEETEKAYYRSEFHYGMFERTVALPPGATEQDVAATYKDGVLEVRIPMRPAATEAAKVPVRRVG